MAETVIYVDTNASGSGSTSIETGLHGRLAALKVVYATSAATGTDVTISEANGLERTFLTVSYDTSSNIYHPRAQTHTAAGVAVSGSFEPHILVGSKIKVAVSSGTASQDNAVEVRILTF